MEGKGPDLSIRFQLFGARMVVQKFELCIFLILYYDHTQFLFCSKSTCKPFHVHMPTFLCERMTLFHFIKLKENMFLKKAKYF